MRKGNLSYDPLANPDGNTGQPLKLRELHNGGDVLRAASYVMELAGYKPTGDMWVQTL